MENLTTDFKSLNYLESHYPLGVIKQQTKKGIETVRHKRVSENIEVVAAKTNLYFNSERGQISSRLVDSGVIYLIYEGDYIFKWCKVVSNNTFKSKIDEVKNNSEELEAKLSNFSKEAKNLNEKQPDELVVMLRKMKKEREAERKAKTDELKRKDEEYKNKLIEKVARGENVDGEDFLIVIRVLNISVHARTAGSIKELRSVSFSGNSVRYSIKHGRTFTESMSGKIRETHSKASEYLIEQN